MRRLVLAVSLLLAGIVCLSQSPSDAACIGTSRVVCLGGSKPYAGPGNIVASAGAFYGLRAYTLAYAVSRGKAINVRRASDSATTDILVLPNGDLDQASASNFGGVDATGTGSISGTTLTFTGGHVGDVITGGTTAPGTAIVSGTSPTWTIKPSQTVASATLTLSWGLFVAEWYDQSGHGLNAIQATAGSQAQLLLNFFHGKPSLWSNAAAIYPISVNVGAPWTSAVIAERLGTAQGFVFAADGGSNLGWAASANTVALGASGTPGTATASDSALHQIIGSINGTTSSLSVDGVTTSIGSVGTNSAVSLALMADNGGFVKMTGYFDQVGFWSGAWTATQVANQHANDAAYWGTP